MLINAQLTQGVCENSFGKVFEEEFVHGLVFWSTPPT